MRNQVKEVTQILGVKNYNRGVLREILINNEIKDQEKFQVLYERSSSLESNISSELRLEISTLIKKVKKEYAAAIIIYDKECTQKIETNALNLSRTKKTMDSMLIDIKNLSKKYAGLVVVDDSSHLSIVVPDSNSYEQKAVEILMTLAQHTKKSQMKKQ